MSMKEIILELMDAMMQNPDVRCDWHILIDGVHKGSAENKRKIDAVMLAYNMSDCDHMELYMVVDGVRAAVPLYERVNDKYYYEGMELDFEPKFRKAV